MDVRGVDELQLQVSGFGGTAPAVWFEPCVITEAAAARAEPPLLPFRTDVRVRAGDVPAGVAVHRPLSGGPERLGDAVVTRVRLPAPEVTPCLCWAAAGRSFYYLNGGTGTVGRVTFPGLEEVRRLEIDRKCSWLSVSAEGLLVTVADRQEIWVLDPDTLRVKQRLRAPSATRAVSAPALSVAFSANPPDGFLMNPRWQVFDLKTGERVDGPAPTYPDRWDRPQLLGATVTPDGTYLFTRGDGLDNQLHRFRIDGPKLEYDGATPPIVSGAAYDLCLSPDGKLVCLPSGGGNAPVVPNHPHLGPFGTYVYSVTDLDRPEFTIEQGPYPTIVAFDPAGRLIYANHTVVTLSVFRPSGVKIKDLTFPGHDVGARQTLVHPAGRKLLMLGDELLSVEITMP